jgi:hypothetical protein
MTMADGAAATAAARYALGLCLLLHFRNVHTASGLLCTLWVPLLSLALLIELVTGFDVALWLVSLFGRHRPK